MFNETTYLGNDADGCPLGLYRRTGRNDPRDPCIADPNYHAPGPTYVPETNCYSSNAPRRSSGADALIALGPCAPGYRRNYCYGECEADPSWRPLPGTESDFTNVDGTLVRRSIFDQFGMSTGGGATSSGGLDSTTMLLLGGLLLFVLMRKK